MSIYTHNKATRVLIMNLPEEIHKRRKVGNDFSLLYNDEIGKTRFHIYSEDSIPVSRLKLDFHRMNFISRSAADEILCQAERISCNIECENMHEDIKKMLQVVSRKHSKVKLLNL